MPMKNTDVLARYLLHATGCREKEIMATMHTPGRGKNKGVLKIQLKTCEDKIDVLRRKSNLKNSFSFKKVYLHNFKSHTDRLIEIDFKTLLH